MVSPCFFAQEPYKKKLAISHHNCTMLIPVLLL